MSLQLEGKVAVVTGASKGIGAGIAKSLAAAGAAVAVNYVSDKAGADKTVNQITSEGGKAFAVQGNTGNEADVQRIFEETLKNYGRLDILVNNAGVYKFESLEEISREEFDRQFDTNVFGPILTTKEAAKHFGEKGGSIINVSSVSSRKAMPGAAVYSATKASLDMISETFALELAPKNIRVNIVAPGPVDTEGFATLGFKGTDFEQGMIAQTPLRRIGQPEDIGRVVTFLASDDSAWITGERLTTAGGMK
ncbi:oxidoreductase [Flavobacterium album]|uniref:Oxidoreductase n=1 Tax=Flavobacterium album TaxID=2175091 RepID=A0A2S1R272_9FLAO|nr:glucose 1-dehydrogenase [Flavobacterium album]AWH86770.1 oxidoreductase [Flavobacterium album]